MQPLDRSRYAWVLMVLLAAWPPAAWAIEQAKTPGVLAWNWPEILACGAISMWGAMARTTQREKQAEAKWTRMEIAHELWRDGWRSSVIGAAVYFAATQHGWNEFQLAGSLLLAGYLGPAALDFWAERFRAKE